MMLDEILMAVARPLNREGKHLSVGHAKAAIIELIKVEVPEEKEHYKIPGKSDSWAGGWNSCRQKMLERLEAMR